MQLTWLCPLVPFWICLLGESVLTAAFAAVFPKQDLLTSLVELQSLLVDHSNRLKKETEILIFKHYYHVRINNSHLWYMFLAGSSSTFTGFEFNVEPAKISGGIKSIYIFHLRS